jgi:hypothetical protein
MNGLWTAEFGTSAGMFVGGVAVFRDGEILGGDGTYYYIGQYTLTGSALHAALTVSPFIQGAESVFGTVGKKLTLVLEGSLVDGDHATAQGYSTEIPGVKFGVKLTKRR